ncbi:MAG TPA: hypothetical protein VME22_28830 [Solirubrobacteraceae bacterium]|nr:hypothetical protein [Solirubrobacteraceae bacterium]
MPPSAVAETGTGAWDEPTLANPVTIPISDTNRTFNLSSTRTTSSSAPRV